MKANKKVKENPILSFQSSKELIETLKEPNFLKQYVDQLEILSQGSEELKEETLNEINSLYLKNTQLRKLTLQYESVVDYTKIINIAKQLSQLKDVPIIDPIFNDTKTNGDQTIKKKNEFQRSLCALYFFNYNISQAMSDSSIKFVNNINLSVNLCGSKINDEELIWLADCLANLKDLKFLTIILINNPITDFGTEYLLNQITSNLQLSNLKLDLGQTNFTSNTPRMILKYVKNKEFTSNIVYFRTIYYLIHSLLEAQDDNLNIVDPSKKYYLVMKDSILSLFINCDLLEHDRLEVKEINRILRESTNIRCIRIQNLFNFTVEMITDLVKGMPNLRQLHFAGKETSRQKWLEIRNRLRHEKRLMIFE